MKTIEYINEYHCPDCNTDWTDLWDCMCDDECPECGCICTPESSQEY